jgi:Fe2+ or Zn2+ uptake regulation protein
MKKTDKHRKAISEYCERWTIPREEIFGLLMKRQQHLSAKEVYGLLQNSDRDIGIATVYRWFARSSAGTAICATNIREAISLIITTI